MRNLRWFISASLSMICVPAFAGTLTCSSSNSSFVSCSLENASERDISVQSVKSGSCELGLSWGVDSDAIWVNKGCSAVFQYTDLNNDQYNNSGSGPKVILTPGLRERPWYDDDDDEDYDVYYYNNEVHHYNDNQGDEVTTQTTTTPSGTTRSVTTVNGPRRSN